MHAQDTTGTFEMACELSKHGVMVAVHKHYSVDEWRQFAAANPAVSPYASPPAPLPLDRTVDNRYLLLLRLALCVCR